MFDNFKGESFKFYRKWLLNTTENELKVLILVSSNQKIRKKYSGTLTDMCKWLDVKTSKYTNDNIKEAIQSLSNKNYISYNKVGNTWNIEVIEDETDEIFYFRYCWLEAIKSFNKDENGKRIDKKLSISWIKLVRIFVYLFEYISGDTVYKYIDIANVVNMSEGTLGVAFKALQSIYLDSILIEKQTVKKAIQPYDTAQNISYRNIGSKFTTGFNWNNTGK